MDWISNFQYGKNQPVSGTAFWEISLPVAVFWGIRPNGIGSCSDMKHVEWGRGDGTIKKEAGRAIPGARKQ
jgi:hypothetical protein